MVLREAANVQYPKASNHAQRHGPIAIFDSRIGPPGEVTKSGTARRNAELLLNMTENEILSTSASWLIVRSGVENPSKIPGVTTKGPATPDKSS